MFNEGDKVRVVANNSHHGFDIGETVVIIRGKDFDGEYKAQYLDGHDFWFVDEDEIEPLVKTLASLRIGDVVWDKQEKHSRKVLAIFEFEGETQFVSIADFASKPDITSLKHLEDFGYPFKGDIKELTLEEVAELAGVDVKNLRIKE